MYFEWSVVNVFTSRFSVGKEVEEQSVGSDYPSHVAADRKTVQFRDERYPLPLLLTALPVRTRHWIAIFKCINIL